MMFYEGREHSTMNFLLSFLTMKFHVHLTNWAGPTKCDKVGKGENWFFSDVFIVFIIVTPSFVYFEPCNRCLVYLIWLLVGSAGGRLNLKPQLEHNVVNP